MSGRGRALLRLCLCTGCADCATDPRVIAEYQPCATPIAPNSTGGVCRWCRAAGGEAA